MVKFSSIKAKVVKSKHLTLQHETGKILLQKSENGKILGDFRLNVSQSHGIARHRTTGYEECRIFAS